MTCLWVFLEVFLEYDILAELLVVVLKRLPGVEVGGLCETGHVVLLSQQGEYA